MLGFLALSYTDLSRGREKESVSGRECEEKGEGVCEEWERVKEMKTETETAKRGRGKGE